MQYQLKRILMPNLTFLILSPKCAIALDVVSFHCMGAPDEGQTGSPNYVTVLELHTSTM